MNKKELEIFNWRSEAELDDWLIRSVGENCAEFTQSWAWGCFEAERGSIVIRLGLRGYLPGGKDQEILAALTLSKRNLAFGFSYWLSARGPVFSSALLQSDLKFRQEAEMALFQAIKKLDHQALFLRMEPMLQPASGLLNNNQSVDNQTEKNFPNQVQSLNIFPFIKTIDLSPTKTLFLDLERGEERLLSDMHPKTRYNIRLAEKKGVIIKVVKTANAADKNELWRLLNLTGARDGFRLHGRRHYESLLDIGAGSSQDSLQLLLAEFRGKNIAAGVFSFFGGRVTYLHGASDHNFRALMAPHLLQWTAIKEALKRGFKVYDFHGLDEAKWPGVSRFKQGFGGREYVYPGTWDVIFQPGFYSAYQNLRLVRRHLGRFLKF